MSDRNFKERVTGTRQMFVSQSPNFGQHSAGKESPWLLRNHAPVLLLHLINYMAPTLVSNMAAPAPAITTAFHLLEKKKKDGEGPLS